MWDVAKTLYSNPLLFGHVWCASPHAIEKQGKAESSADIRIYRAEAHASNLHLQR